MHASPVVALLLASAVCPACSASLEALATVDSEGAYGAQVTLEVGLAFAVLDHARQFELTTGGGVAVDGPVYGLFDLGLQYSDARLGSGFGQRAGLHFLVQASGDVHDDDTLAGVGASWSLLANLSGPGDEPDVAAWFYSRDQLGVTLHASYRGQVGDGSRSRAVFGLGPRYTRVVGAE